ncbi:MAG: hypothetical protein MJ214_01870 [Bacilli bacterium]|nr:hypothetical protein [Bacilli bacterium]
MKKLGLLLMPLTAVSFLASCGGSKNPTITFDGGKYLTIDNTECKNLTEFTAKISVKDEYLGKYEVPQNEVYYEITRNNEEIDNFQIIEDDSFNSVFLKIPEEEMTGNIIIKTEGFCHYLTFTGAGGEYVSYSCKGNISEEINIQYCNNLDTPVWKDWGVETKIYLTGENSVIYVRNTTNTLSKDDLNRVKFNAGASDQVLLASGNIMSLLNFNNLQDYSFYELFGEIKMLVTSPVLPATTLTNHCYMDMFFGCSSLISAPKLPATTMTDYCYCNMFRRCSALTIAPKLPATALDQFCYSAMFSDCSALTTAPKLPATALATNCYATMFADCVSLKKAPELPATTLAPYCYLRMFEWCLNLKINNTGTGTKFFDCSDTTTDGCVADMFLETGGTYTADPVPGESYYYTLD